MKNFFVPFIRNIKKLGAGIFSLYIAIVFLLIISISLTALHTYFSLTYLPTEENSMTDTKTIKKNNIETKVENNKTIRYVIDVMDDLIPTLLTLVTSLLTFSSIGLALVGARVSIAPTLRVIAKKEGNNTIMYAENIGKGPLVLTNIKSSPHISYGCSAESLEHLKKVTQSINESYPVSLAEKEQIILLKYENKKHFHGKIMETLRCTNFVANFTDTLGNSYEQKIKPEVYTDYEERIQQANTKPSNT